ncbi:MAG: tripartite tricarboxylate transporter TctB family protein [Synergistaceae bacterium]|jgi:putative tricarboxylic transport membrane protein|nr:tripartite tricarboxylate transporter TctB family protein [Synergistaceae bacterium]
MRFNDAVIGVAAIVFGLVVVVHVQSYPDMGDGMPGPSLFPTVLGVLLMIAGAVQIPRGIKSRAPFVKRLPDFTARGVVNIAVTVLGVLFYIYASDFLGFLLTSFLAMFVPMLTLKGKFVLSALAASGATLCIYLIFCKMLLVPLPTGLFYF